MILRRLIEHLRHQHWTLIAIDLVIVVVGVFIGTQVSNWNDARIERGLARDNPGFAAYLRTQREWAILHYNLLHNLSPKTDALLKTIDAEIARP